VTTKNLDKQVFSLRETALKLGISMDVLKVLCETKRIRHMKISSTGNLPRIKIAQKAIDDFITAQEQINN